MALCVSLSWAHALLKGAIIPGTPKDRRGHSKTGKALFNLDGPIRVNRFADSRESLDSRESFQGSRTDRANRPDSRCESPCHLSYSMCKNIIINYGIVFAHGIVPRTMGFLSCSLWDFLPSIVGSS